MTNFECFPFLKFWNDGRKGSNKHFWKSYDCNHKTTKTMQNTHTKSDDSFFSFSLDDPSNGGCDRFSIHQFSLTMQQKPIFQINTNNNRNQRRDISLHPNGLLESYQKKKKKPQFIVWHISKRWRHISIWHCFYHTTECGFWL